MGRPILGCELPPHEHLIKRYHIQARCLISVHHELRYLVKEEDKYCAALELEIQIYGREQCLDISSAWYGRFVKGIAFSSAMDVDKWLRKEVDMECVTPVPIPPGESLNIEGVLEKTGGSLVEEQGTECVSGSSSEGCGILENACSRGLGISS